MFRIDPGWPFLIAGLALIVSAVLIPAQRELHDLEQRLKVHQAYEEQAKAQVLAYEQFISDLSNNATNGRLLERLVRAQLNKMPKDERPLLLMPTANETVPAWIESSVAIQIPEPTPYVDTLLSRIASGPRRLWVLATGTFLVFLGVMFAPTSFSSRRRREEPEAESAGAFEASGGGVAVLDAPEDSGAHDAFVAAEECSEAPSAQVGEIGDRAGSEPESVTRCEASEVVSISAADYAADAAVLDAIECGACAGVAEAAVEVEAVAVETDEVETDEVEAVALETDEAEAVEAEAVEVEAVEVEAVEVEAVEVEAVEVEAVEVEAVEVEAVEVEAVEVEAVEVEAVEVEAVEVEAVEVEAVEVEAVEVEAVEVEAVEVEAVEVEAVEVETDEVAPVVESAAPAAETIEVAEIDSTPAPEASEPAVCSIETFPSDIAASVEPEPETLDSALSAAHTHEAKDVHELQYDAADFDAVDDIAADDSDPGEEVASANTEALPGEPEAEAESGATSAATAETLATDRALDSMSLFAGLPDSSWIETRSK